jgi:hypothetical protein
VLERSGIGGRVELREPGEHLGHREVEPLGLDEVPDLVVLVPTEPAAA